MKILMLAFSNLKKRKSAGISLFLLVFLASLMLNIGLSIFSRLNTFVLDKTAELNGAHFIANLIHDENYQKQIDFISNYTYADKTEKEDSILFYGAETPYGNGKQTLAGVIILNADTKRSISPLRLVEKVNKPTPDCIYLPYAFKVGGGYSLGDTIRFNVANKEYAYKVGGFFEDTTLGSTMAGSVKAFLNTEGFAALGKSTAGVIESTFVAVRLTDLTKTDDLSKEFNKRFFLGMYAPNTSIDILISEMNYTMPIKVVASVLIAFAIIILVVSLVVVKFRVSNSIEDDMANIGSLKAIGYSSSQILSSIIVQFLIISISASVLGLTISYVVMPVLGQLISTSVGLLWTSRTDVFINLISLSAVIVLVLAVTLTTALKVRRITPIAALRGGIQTHNFKRNHFPLNKYSFNLQFLIGLKNIANSTKQNIFIMLIIASLCFASIFCSVIYYNFSVDKASLFSIVGSEHCNVTVYTKPGMDAAEMFEEINSMEDVKQTGMLSPQAAVINNEAVFMYVSTDYSQIEWNNVYEGRQPENDNEIAISGMIAKAMTKKIGDTIEISFGDNKKNFLITGLSQQIGNAGRVAAVTLEGYNRIKPDYKQNELSVYLKVKNNTDFIDKIKLKYPEQLLGTVDLDSTAESQMGAIVNTLFSVMVLIFIISIIVISLILYYLIKTIILKHKREFGIYKATGYTTLQLMMQIAFSFVPVVSAGALLGGMIGYFYSNQAMSLLLSGLGIYNAKFTVDLTSIILICIGMVLTAYIVAMLVAHNVRKITAYSLITE